MRTRCFLTSVWFFLANIRLISGHNLIQEDSQTTFNSKPLRPQVGSPTPNPSLSFWLDTPSANPLADEGSQGALTADADVCVVGSGITGVGVAWHLANAFGEAATKKRVVVLEARRFCSGATGRNGGHLTPSLFSSFVSLRRTYGSKEALKSLHLERHTTDSLLEFISQRGLEQAVDLVQGGHVTIFRTEEEEAMARKDWEAMREEGADLLEEEVRWLGKEEMTEKYGLDSELGYTGVYHAGQNLWPCKLVTHLFRNGQSTAEKKNVDLVLHTNTPVTGFERISPSTSADGMHAGPSTPARRWRLQTPRGPVNCSYIVHATNGYAAHLLPFLAGTTPYSEPGPSEHDINLAYSNPNNLPNPLASPSSDPSLASRSPRPPPGSPPTRPRGWWGIVPTRGQVGAVRAAVNASELGWLNSWDGGGGGWEYWFPRYQGTEANSTLGENDIERETGSANPLIILGGGREFSGGTLEMGVTDDSVLNERVRRALRAFLPTLFPGQFATDGTGGGSESGIKDPWEMEWTGIMGFTRSGDPFVGPIDFEDHHLDGQYIAAGYTGHGMPRAFGCAEAVAGMIKAHMAGEEWEAPAWLPERYLTWATRA
ncbi:FAD dependent oxidoreductase [Crassisporium funariophilum]|nr:FAD dependent oxidoreductase [Crassisporium funariophilum]